MMNDYDSAIQYQILIYVKSLNNAFFKSLF